MSYAYLFKYIIIGDTGNRPFPFLGFFLLNTSFFCIFDFASDIDWLLLGCLPICNAEMGSYLFCECFF